MHVIVLFIARLFFYGYYGYRGQQAGARALFTTISFVWWERMLSFVITQKTSSRPRLEAKQAIWHGGIVATANHLMPAYGKSGCHGAFRPAGLAGISQKSLVCESSQVTMYMSKIHKIR